ncbi:Cation channel sperm-associated protein 4 [Sorochytrium milnesiophthora]
MADYAHSTALQAQSPDSRPTKRHAFLRSSLEIELTYPAFRLPGVYDRKLDQSFQRYNADESSNISYRRVFLPPEQFPANRRFSAVTGTRSYAIEKRTKNTYKTLPDGTEELKLVGMGDINRQVSQDADDDDNTYVLCQKSVRVAEPVRVKNSDSYTKVRETIFKLSRNMNVSRLEKKDITFSSIVDIDDEAFESYVSEDLAARFGEGPYFRVGMLLVIIANSAMIGMQTDYNLSHNYPNMFIAADSVFLTIFIMEIMFKWYYAFISFWKSGWNWIDFGLVIVTLLGPLVSFSQSSRILRMVRVVRAFRSLRSVNALQGMYTILQVILRSIPDMANIMFLCLILLFIFAVIGVTLFSSVMSSRFGDIGTSMFTLFVIMTEDGWVNIVTELQDRGSFSTGAIFCCAWITVGGFVFANLIVAVVVTNLEVTYDNIKLQMKKKYRQLKNSSKQGNGQAIQRALVNVDEQEAETTFSAQVPYELPDFDRITESKMQKYFLLLSIIEENLREYLHIKEQLNEILMELKVINSAARTAETRLDADYEEGEEEVDAEDPDMGDPLSRLLRQRT